MSKKIGERLEQLEPKKRLEILIKLMPFVFQRMNAMSLNHFYTFLISITH
jgi:hypothetical protein